MKGAVHFKQLKKQDLTCLGSYYLLELFEFLELFKTAHTFSLKSLMVQRLLIINIYFKIAHMCIKWLKELPVMQWTWLLRHKVIYLGFLLYPFTFSKCSFLPRSCFKTEFWFNLEACHPKLLMFFLGRIWLSEPTFSRVTSAVNHKFPFLRIFLHQIVCLCTVRIYAVFYECMYMYKYMYVYLYTLCT